MLQKKIVSTITFIVATCIVQPCIFGMQQVIHVDKVKDSVLQKIDPLIKKINKTQNPAEHDEQGRTVLHHLAEQGNVDRIDYWLKQCEVNLNPYGTEELFVEKWVPLLNMQDVNNDTPLDLAKKNQHIRVCILLCMWGASCAQTDS